MEKDPFSKWDKSNPCFGCPAICCTDVKIPLEPPNSAGGSSLKELADPLFPHIVNPDEPVEEREVDITSIPVGSVVFCLGTRTGRWYLVIKGPCPLLLSDGRCSAHNKKRPWGCTHSGPSKLFPKIFSKCPK
jgi:hypothetical protein